MGYNKVDLGTDICAPAGLDTVRITLPTPIPERGLTILDQKREIRPSDALPFTVGSLRNLRVRATAEETTVHGSLSTFLYGHNLYPIDPSETYRALEEIGALLNVKPDALWNGQVTRLDIAATLSMSRPVSAYLRPLGDRSRSRRRNHRWETVAYETRDRTQHYYDKLLEMEPATMNRLMPETVGNMNLLRYEVQYKRRLARRFGCPISTESLVNEQFLHTVRQDWLRLHEEVPKHRIPFIDVPRSIPKLNTALQVAGLEALGGEAALQALIAEAYAADDVTKSQSRRLRNRVRQLASDEDFTLPDCAVRELDSAIARAAALS